MAFCVKISDATKFKGDAVLNSLGIDGRKYGRLCKSIITAANDSSITNFVNSKTNSKPGDIYLTSGGNLKAKNIIHLVTPFKKDDDGNKNLKDAYSAVINFAIEQGYKKICLPLIGTGSNGYSQSESYDAVTSACAEVSELEDKENREFINKNPSKKSNNTNFCLEFIKNNNVGLDSGIEGLIKSLNSNRTNNEIVRDYSRIILKKGPANTVAILPQTLAA